MEECYSQITNELFYIKDENGNKTRQGSILDCVKDDKVIIILHELYINSSFRRTYHLNLDFFIKQCGYQVNQKSKKNFKSILNKLKELNLIKFKEDFKEKIVIIDTEQLILKSSKEFVKFTDEEMNKINDVKDLRLRTTLLRLYLYLKSSTYKRSINEKTGKIFNIQLDAKPQVTWQSYEYIEKIIKIGQSHINEYILKLKKLKLIDYASCGNKYHSEDKNKRITQCPNIYTICSINDYGNEQELEFGIKQCKYSLEKQGWVIVKTNYKNNNRYLNGKKGGLMKKLNNGTITDEQRKELKMLKEK
ncbi:TPA: hypothetical protein LA460_000257 [Clostridium botulinum]|nr:hypothetical protein [Clostridium botulinum]HBJ1652861.1 hypothetical protein [Clostridium botulinum]